MVEYGNPNYATGCQWYGLLLRDIGEKEEAISIMGRAEQSDPTSLIIKINLAMMHYQAGLNEKALMYADGALNISPTFSLALNMKYVQLLADGVDGGIEIFRERLSADKEGNEGRESLFQLYLMKGDRAAAFEQFTEIVGNPRTSREECGTMAGMYFRLGKLDLANIWLEMAIENHEPGLWGYAMGKDFVEWQKHPKFIELMKSVNHPLYVDK